MGRMLAGRIARADPDRVDRLVLTAPIGLEDDRLHVPQAAFTAHTASPH
jgi:pimeloyl-ACP methyl ester carboxylesterase